MMQALANLIHTKLEEKQSTPKPQHIQIVPINPNKKHVKEINKDTKSQQ